MFLATGRTLALTLGIPIVLAIPACSEPRPLKLTGEQAWSRFEELDGSRVSITGHLVSDRDGIRHETGLLCDALGKGDPFTTGSGCLAFVDFDMSSLRSIESRGPTSWTRDPFTVTGILRNFMGWGERPELEVTDVVRATGTNGGS